MKNIKLFAIVALASIALGTYAQKNDSYATFPDGEITYDTIVYAHVRLDVVNELGKYNSGVTLSQDTIKAWGDYSCFVRFNNVSNGTSNENIIDLRSGGAFVAPLETVHFVPGGIYHIWFDVKFATNTYDVYVQSPDTNTPVKLYAGATFRKANPISLKYISSLRNANESPNPLTIIEFKKTDTIGLPSSDFSLSATAICLGNTVNFTSASTNPNDTYEWNFGEGASPATANTSGSHTVSYASTGEKTISLTINGSITTTKIINVNALPTAEALVAPAAFCAGAGTSIATASSNVDLSYQLVKNGSNEGASVAGTGNAIIWENQSAGIYKLIATITATGCSATSAEVTSTETALPAKPAITVNGAVLSSSATNGNKWFLNDSEIANATASTFTATENGNYKVEVTANGCSAVSDAVELTITSIQNTNTKSLVVYPNPGNGIFTLQLSNPAKTVEVSIIDLLGNVIYKSEQVSVSEQINPGKIFPGTYFVRVNNNNQISVQRLVVQ